MERALYFFGDAQREVEKNSYWIESSDLAKATMLFSQGFFFSGQNMKNFSSRAFPHCVRLQTPQNAHGLRHVPKAFQCYCIENN